VEERAAEKSAVLGEKRSGGKKRTKSNCRKNVIKNIDFFSQMNRNKKQ
jgi:hypothetical protein